MMPIETPSNQKDGNTRIAEALTDWVIPQSELTTPQLAILALEQHFAEHQVRIGLVNNDSAKLPGCLYCFDYLNGAFNIYPDGHVEATVDYQLLKTDMPESSRPKTPLLPIDDM